MESKMDGVVDGSDHLHDKGKSESYKAVSIIIARGVQKAVLLQSKTQHNTGVAWLERLIISLFTNHNRCKDIIFVCHVPFMKCRIRNQMTVVAS
jgi:hypothetical protein